MTFATITRADTEEYYYFAMPDIGDGEIRGISMLKESFVVGEQVIIVQVGTLAVGAEYGFCRETNRDIKTVLEVPDSQRAAIIERSPGQTVCAYIARKAGKFQIRYLIGEVLEVLPNSLRISYLNQPTFTARLAVVGVTAADFEVGEKVAIDVFQFGQDVVVGWWEILTASDVTLSISITVDVPLPGGVATIKAEVNGTPGITQSPTLVFTLQKNITANVVLGDFDENYPSFGRWFRASAGSGNIALYLISGDTSFSVLMNDNKSFVIPCQARFLLQLFSIYPDLPSIAASVSSEFIAKVNSWTGELGLGACTPNSTKTIEPDLADGWDSALTTWKIVSTWPYTDIETESFEQTMDKGYSITMYPVPVFITDRGFPSTITVSGGPAEVNGVYSRIDPAITDTLYYVKSFPGYFLRLSTYATIAYHEEGEEGDNITLFATAIIPSPTGVSAAPRRGWPGDLLLT